MSKERMPGATWMLLPEANGQGSYRKTQLIYHSTGTKAGARANYKYFAQAKVAVESTFIVDYDGEILQVMPATARADANGKANQRAMSVEVVGTADEPYTAEQVAACIAIGRWATEEHPILPRVITSEITTGIGWHVMFGAPGPWTNVRGKACPGPQRIAQVRDVIIPALTMPTLQPAGLLAQTPTTPPAQESDMAASFTFHDGEKTYWRDGGDTIHIPHASDVTALHTAGVRPIGRLTPEFTARLVEAAKQ